jgi:glucose-6-phosphate isomerase
MITVDLKRTNRIVTEHELEKALTLAEQAGKQVANRTCKGSEWLGWQSILETPNDAELDEITSHAAKIREDADIFIVCGIGGSYTGAMAVIEALNPVFKNNGPEILFAGHHMGSKYLKELLEYLDEEDEDGNKKSVYLNVISKSGSTLETALAFRFIRHWMHKTYDDASKRIIATTGKKGGVLNKIIDEAGYKKYIIPDDVGGRFSVLTPVGLLPIAVAGIDIQTLFYGAVSQYKSTEKDPDQTYLYAATRYVLHQKKYAIDVLSTFEPGLNGMIAWMQQLLGESEGKEGKGLYPASAGYSTDLHSIGQLIQDGQRNIMETIIEVKSPVTDLRVPQAKELDTDSLGYLAGKSMHEINRSAQEGTAEAHEEGSVPVMKVILDRLNAQHLGELIYFYEYLTAIYVTMLDVNPFNQPGVESYKQAMYRLLGKEN